MDFITAINIVKNAISKTGLCISTDQYDGLIVKKVVASNSLDEDRTTNQTHIAITGTQMDIFPYLCADGYFYKDGAVVDVDLKKFFVISVPVTIFEKNLIHLGYSGTEIPFNNGERETSTCVVRSKRENQTDQLQVSMLNMDGPDFITFRKFVKTSYYFILLKIKSSLKYHAFGVNAALFPDEEKNLSQLNNLFFKQPTNTIVQASVFNNITLAQKKTDRPFRIGENIILYGVPGCGKSHKIKTDYCDDEDYMERVVFHPDYTYSDFIGQILPENDNGHITYPFIPGPFTRVLTKAEADPDNNYYLIIEELNRGNAPAIFGEIFQLLDRIDGVSEYGINNADIALQVYGDADHQVKLPKNLFILATMNTADQNVFTLDTAFKRRWKMRSITNDINGCFFGGLPICNSNVSWKSFLKTINEKIIELGEGSIGSEDKRLGAYFVQSSELSDIDSFAEKVLMYLWNDAFKYEHEKVFKAQYKTLEQLIDGFKSVLFDVFDSNLQFERTRVEPVDDVADDTDEIMPEQYLQSKSENSKSIYNSMLNEINDVGIDYSVGAVKNYLSIKAPNGKIAAELHLQSDKVQVLIKEPQNDDYKIGRKLPDSYRWSKNYEIIADNNSNIGLIVSAIIDSYDQVNG